LNKRNETSWKTEPDPRHLDGQPAIEFLIETCLVTRTTGHGDFNPHHTVWKAPAN
jgi:hypothetical protein